MPREKRNLSKHVQPPTHEEVRAELLKLFNEQESATRGDTASLHESIRSLTLLGVATFLQFKLPQKKLAVGLLEAVMNSTGGPLLALLGLSGSRIPWSSFGSETLASDLADWTRLRIMRPLLKDNPKRVFESRPAEMLSRSYEEAPEGSTKTDISKPEDSLLKRIRRSILPKRYKCHLLVPAVLPLPLPLDRRERLMRATEEIALVRRVILTQRLYDTLQMDRDKLNPRENPVEYAEAFLRGYRQVIDEIRNVRRLGCTILQNRAKRVQSLVEQAGLDGESASIALLHRLLPEMGFRKEKGGKAGRKGTGKLKRLPHRDIFSGIALVLRSGVARAEPEKLLLHRYNVKNKYYDLPTYHRELRGYHWPR